MDGPETNMRGQQRGRLEWTRIDQIFNLKENLQNTKVEFREGSSLGIQWRES